jgi:hypothetical protein
MQKKYYNRPGLPHWWELEGKGGGPGGKGMGVSVLGDWDKVAVVLIFSQGTDEVEMGRTGERSV